MEYRYLLIEVQGRILTNLVHLWVYTSYNLPYSMIILQYSNYRTIYWKHSHMFQKKILTRRNLFSTTFTPSFLTPLISKTWASSVSVTFPVVASSSSGFFFPSTWKSLDILRDYREICWYLIDVPIITNGWCLIICSHSPDELTIIVVIIVQRMRKARTSHISYHVPISQN